MSAARGFPVRYRVVAFVTSLAALTYLDRVCISVLAPTITKEFHLTDVEMGYVFSAFTLTYVVGGVPAARLGERIGSRAIVSGIVTWWSSFTILTGAAWNYASLIAMRLFFGVGEAGAWPSAARVFSRWIPAKERGTVQGIFFAGAHLSGGLTPAIVIWLATFLSWRYIFCVCGALGFFWGLAWYRWFRNEPQEMPGVSAAECELILSQRNLPREDDQAKGSMVPVLKNRSTIFLCLMYISNSYGSFFLVTWLPTYLQKVRGFERAELAVFAGLPMTLSVFADLLGGATTDWLTKKFGLRVGRCSIGVVGYLIAGAAMVVAAGTAEAKTAAVLIAVAAASSMFTLAPTWASCIDIGRTKSGMLAAAMNSCGNFGGFLSPIILAYLVKAFSDWAIPLYVLAALYFFSALCWLLIRPDKPLDTVTE